MKRIWAAIVIFIAVVILCGIGIGSTTITANQMIQRVEEVEEKIVQQDYDGAISLTESIQDNWSGSGKMFCAFLGHNQLETIDAELNDLTVRLDYQEESYAMEHCSHLKDALRKIQRMDLPLLENIL